MLGTQRDSYRCLRDVWDRHMMGSVPRLAQCRMSDSANPANKLPLLRRAAWLTAGSGIIFSILAMISLVTVPNPDNDYLASQIQPGDSATRFVALYIFPIAGISFIWFIVSLRMWIPARTEKRVNALLSNVQLVSGIVFLVLFFTSAAALSVSSVFVSDEAGKVYTVSSIGFPQYGNSLFFVFASRMGAMFVFSTSGIARETEVLPKWFVWIGYVVGLFMLLSSSFNQALFFVFPVWTLVLCILVLVHFSHVYRHLSTAEPEESDA